MILSGQVSSPSEGGGGPETVKVTIANNYATSPNREINYYDGVTSSNITKVLSDINEGEALIIPKDSLVVLYSTSSSTYSPYMVEVQSDVSAPITKRGKEDWYSSYWNNVYKISLYG